jgi:hypothetical protein
MSDPGIGPVGGAPMAPATSDLQVNAKQTEQKQNEEQQASAVDANAEAAPRELYGTGEQVNVSA